MILLFNRFRMRNVAITTATLREKSAKFKIYIVVIIKNIALNSP